MQTENGKAQGKKAAGYYCAWTPLEILDAAGILPVALNAPGEETIPAGEGDLPKNLCPAIKSAYGYAVTQGPRYAATDLIVGETTCDGKKKMYDLLARKKPTYVLQIPQGVDQPYARPLWVKELRHFIQYLQENCGATISEEALRKAAEKRNQLRAARRGLMELQKSARPPLDSAELYAFLEESESIADPDEALAVIEDFTKAAASRTDEGAAKKRILVTGCPLGGAIGKIAGPIEENGGRVVCYENCKGMKSAGFAVNAAAQDIVEGIADAYLQIGCAVMHNNDARKESLAKLAGEFGVDGVIDVSLQTCHTYTIETKAIRKLCDGLGLPYLALETDYSQQNAGQLSTRIAAFMELLHDTEA